MQRMRNRYPYHVPCRVCLPDNHQLKLILPEHATIACTMVEVRKRWKGGCISENDALFCFHEHKICIGSTRIASLDTQKPDAVCLHIRKENTFG